MRLVTLTALAVCSLLGGRRPGEGTGALLVAAQRTSDPAPSITVRSEYCGCELDDDGGCFDGSFFRSGDCIPDFRLTLFRGPSFDDDEVVAEFDCPESSYTCEWENVRVSKGRCFSSLWHQLPVLALDFFDSF